MTLDASLLDRIRRHGQWYHTLELAPGVVTPGWFDTRSLPPAVGFPTDLRGRRALDVATFDGFWAFAMEARGAAEVVAIDVLDEAAWDWPARSRPAAVAEIGRRKDRGVGFELAREALGSSVVRIERSVYDLEPAVHGRFDFVYVGSLLLHLQNPVAALEAVRSVCNDDARVLVVDAVDVGLTARHPRRPVAALDAVGRPWWWKPNRAALLRMVEAARFDLAGRPRMVTIPAGAGQPRLRGRTAAAALRHRGGREALLRTSVGDPHLAVAARPA